MRSYYRVDDVRQAERTRVEAAQRATGDPDVMMKRAAAGVSAVCAARLGDLATTRQNALSKNDSRTLKCLLLVGGGDNGGDALYAAAMLCGQLREADKEVEVKAVLLSPRVHQRALAAARTAGVDILTPPQPTGSGVEQDWQTRVLAQARDADLWVDGIVGTGARGALRQEIAALVSALESLRTERGKTVVAVDVHTGVTADDGTLNGPALGADEVVTMGALKSALILPPAADLHDRVHLVDLGMELTVTPSVIEIDAGTAKRNYPAPRPPDHKYTRGVVGITTGSTHYPGAALLSLSGAISVGPGMIRYLGEKELRPLVLAHFPEVVTQPGRVQADVIGCGMLVHSDEQRDLIGAALTARTDVPLVVDAGALPVIPEVSSEDSWGARPLVLTPHPGEAAALLRAYGQRVRRENVEQAPKRYARQLADLTGAVVVLKLSATVIASPAGQIWCQRQAPAWAATAGCGDVLAGMIGAWLALWQARREETTLARAETPTGVATPGLDEAVASAVWLHGMAADQASAGGPLRASAIGPAATAILASLIGGGRGGQRLANLREGDFARVEDSVINEQLDVLSRQERR